MLVATLAVSSFVIFSALYLAPGNPIAVLSGGRTLPPESIKILEARYHLNDPFFTQYWLWLKGALHGDFGISIALRENVSTLIASRIGTTAALVLYASVLILVIGIGLGLVICRGSVEGHGGRIGAEGGAEGGTTMHVTLPLSDRSGPWEVAPSTSTSNVTP